MFVTTSINISGSGLELSRCILLHVAKGDWKEGVRSSLVITFAAARCQGPRFYPGQGRNLNRDFCSMRPLFRLWDYNIVYQSQSQAPNKWIIKWRVDRMDAECRYVGRKEETRMKCNGRWRRGSGKNTELWKARGKAVDTNTRASPIA